MERRRPPGERGGAAWKHQNKECVRAGAVWKDGEELDHWRRGCGVRTLWIIKSGGGLSRAGARGDGSGGVPEHLGSHFPRSAPTPNTPVPRGAGGAQLVTYPMSLERRGATSCQAGAEEGEVVEERRGSRVAGCSRVRPATEFHGVRQGVGFRVGCAAGGGFICASLASHYLAFPGLRLPGTRPARWVAPKGVALQMPVPFKGRSTGPRSPGLEAPGSR